MGMEENETGKLLRIAAMYYALGKGHPRRASAKFGEMYSDKTRETIISVMEYYELTHELINNI